MTDSISARSRHKRRGRGAAAALMGLFTLAAMRTPCRAQISFAEAVRLAVENSPRVKAAQNELLKAHSALLESKDFYVPSIVLTGGRLGLRHYADGADDFHHRYAVNGVQCAARVLHPRGANGHAGRADGA